MIKFSSIPNCSVCDELLTINDSKKILKDPFGVDDSDFNYVKCNNCHSWILNPRPLLNEMRQFYEEDFLFDINEIKDKSSSVIQNLARKVQEFNMISEVNWACKFIDKDTAYLDNSAGNGQILNLIAKKKPGRYYYATEFSETYRDYLSQFKSITQVYDDLGSIETNLKFDVISLFGVLEHVENPRKLVNTLKEKLNPGGKLILSVPNVNSLQRFIFGNKWYSWLAPRHWQMFNIISLKRLMEEIDFQVINEKHFFLRTCSATLVISLFPYLDPLKKGGTIKMLLYAIFFYSFIPFELFAGLFKKSGFMGIVTEKNKS